MESKRFDVNVTSCELVGLIPKKALINSLRYYLACEGKTISNDIDLDELTELSIKYIGFRDFDKLKIIEGHLDE